MEIVRSATEVGVVAVIALVVCLCAYASILRLSEPARGRRGMPLDL